MTDHRDPIEERLRRLGGQPVDPSLASQHLTAMAMVAPGGAPLGRRLRVGAAFLAGLLVGGTGLASAGALGPAQGVAHSALGRVGINVPDDDGDKKPRHNGPECTDADGNPIPDLRNHGQYVRSQAKGDRSEAAQSDCGKPVQAVDSDDVSGEPTDEGKDAEKQAEKDARKAEQEQRKSDPPPSTVPAARPADAGPPTTVTKPGKAEGHSGESPGNGSEGQGRGQHGGSSSDTD